MSETVIARGKLTPTGLTIGGFFVQKGIVLSEDDGVEESFDELFHETHTLVDGLVYERKGTVKPEYEDDISQATINLDGTIDYLLMYYNGGCCLDEALQSAITTSLQKKV